MADVTQSLTNQIVSGDAAQLARRYALALFQMAEEARVTDAIAADIKGLQQVWASEETLRAVASDPRLKREQVMAVARKISESTKLQPLMANTLGLLAKNRRLDLLPAVMDRFMAELAARRGEYMADVRTAHPLTPAQTEALTKKLTALAGGKVTLHTKQDVSLLGGFVVKLGSRMIDASVRGKLERLGRQLTSSSTTNINAA